MKQAIKHLMQKQLMWLINIKHLLSKMEKNECESFLQREFHTSLNKKNQYYMKKTAILFSFFVMISLTGCTNFLTTQSLSTYTPDVVFSNPTYAKDAVMGIYDLLCTDYTYSSRLPLSYTTNSDIEFAGADEGSYNQNNNRGTSNYFASPDNADISKVWQTLYQIIERSNLCIQNIPTSPATNDPSTKAEMMGYYGEALTLRAIAYFELVRTFGDVPFTTKPAAPDGSNFLLPATDRDTIMDHLISDLQEAEQYVPWVGTGEYSSTERITKGFIKGLVARICLARGGYALRNKPGYPTERGSDWQKYYQIADNECESIITNGTHKLNPSYINIWKTLNQLQVDNTYHETMFEVALGLQHSGEIGYSIGVRFYTNPEYGYGNNANVVNTSAYYFYMFDPKDLRRDVTVALATFGNSSGATQEFLQQNPISYNIAKWDQRWMSAAFLAGNLHAQGKVGYGINWVMMRYADVLLMYAETENELNNGPTPAAIDALKQVRRRAFNSIDWPQEVDAYVNALTNHDSFFNAIVKERALEFGGEGLRKWDLVRWNLLGTKIQEQRDAIAAMFNRTAPYDTLPQTIFYKYLPDGQTIDRSSMNFYQDWGTTPPDPSFSSAAWLSGLSATNQALYLLRINLFSSGLNSAAGVQNRYLYPIPTTVISSSNGLLKNAYGY